MDLYKKTGIGGIVRMDRDGKDREVFARGIRNSVGIDFNPKDKTLWFTDNQVDGMGDDIPPGETQPRRQGRAELRLSVLSAAARSRTDGVQGRSSRRPNVVVPQVEMAAHAADLGLTFYTGTHVPGRSIAAASSRRSTARGTAQSRSARASCSRP